LTQFAVRRAQIDALKCIFPELDDDLMQHLPQFSHELGDGFILLRPREKTAQGFSEAEANAIGRVCEKEKRQKWGRLQLPNGQIARSLYSENRRMAENTRNSRNVKVFLLLYYRTYF
jgi:hypothetical protein